MGAPQYKFCVSFDFWDAIEGLRIEGEMSEAGIGEAAKQRRRWRSRERKKLDQGDLTIRNVPLYVHRSEPGIKNAL